MAERVQFVGVENEDVQPAHWHGAQFAQQQPIAGVGLGPGTTGTERIFSPAITWTMLKKI